MSDFLTRNRLVLAKIETTSGTDATPVPASDAVLVEGPKGTPTLELEQTNEVTGSLDHSQSIVGGGYMQHTCDFYAKGSGTPGTVPEADPYYRAAAMGVTTLAADETGTAQAGTTSSITLAAAAPSSDLTGFVVATTGGTGNGQTRVIKGYDTTTKVATVSPDWDTAPDATTTYTVYAGNLYVPVSEALETLTHYLYKKNSGSGNAILEAMVGAAVQLTFAVQTRQSGKFTATLRGKLQTPGDVANPTGAVFDATRPRPLRDADAYLGGSVVCFRNLTLDWGNQVIQGDCPSEVYGYEAARVVDRRIVGRINPKLVTLTSRNAFADLVAGTTKPLWLNWGEIAGNRVSIFLPAISYTGKEDDDLNGYSADGLPFEATGIDSGIYLLFY